MLSPDQIRSAYLAFFEARGHTRHPSDSLVPENDPTLLFTGAGMNQFKAMFLGKGHLPFTRATTTQKCLRMPDLENVGRTASHHTFFEMLGNFSFGDYFKKDALPFAWTLLTGEWKLPADRLFATIFRGEAGVPRDSEAYDISVPIVILTAALLGGGFVFIISKAVQARHRAVHTGIEEMLGAHGVVRSPLEPVGHVFVKGALWRARSEAPLEVGEKVVVDAVEGLTLTVSPDPGEE